MLTGDPDGTMNDPFHQSLLVCWIRLGNAEMPDAIKNGPNLCPSMGGLNLLCSNDVGNTRK